MGTQELRGEGAVPHRERLQIVPLAQKFGIRDVTIQRDLVDRESIVDAGGQKLSINGAAKRQHQRNGCRITTLAPLAELVACRSAVGFPLPGLGACAVTLIELYRDLVAQAVSEVHEQRDWREREE